ncbi:MAG: hypothetical protein P8101_05135 [Candidatus Thiodiazotropha sp.]
MSMNISAIPSGIAGHDRLANFRFHTPYGMAYLRVPFGNSDVASTISIIDCIRALQTIESFIRDIEDWFSFGIDVEPVDSTQVDSSYSRIQLKERSSNNLIIILIAEESLLKLMSPPANIMEKYVIETSDIDSNLLLSSLVLESDEISRIVKDNIILLSESFNPKWHVEISTRIGSTVCAHYGVLDNSLKTIMFGPEVNPHKDVLVPLNSDCKISVIAEHVPVPLSYYLGWKKETDEYILAESLRACDMKICTKQGVLGQGKLLNISNGFGLYINGLV